MKTLNYNILKELNYDGYLLKDAPERILQFGEGNFLRAFVEDFVDRMNERCNFHTKVVVCQPASKDPAGADRLNCQQGLYTLLLRGYENGREVEEKRIISCISRCLNVYRDYEVYMDCAKNPSLRFILCNTTEAGIVYDPTCQFTDTPSSSYPGKLTQFLYRRFQAFGNIPGKGFAILACELIDNNGAVLKEYVLRHARQWALGAAFEKWLETENFFCSTLVDRIVTGYPKAEAEALQKRFGYIDNCMVTGEIFANWVIEGPDWLKEELPFAQAGLPVLICNNHKPYKQRKVRILNGAHTAMVPGAYLAGKQIVRDCMEDSVIFSFLEKTLQKEIIPTLSLPRQDLEDFATSVKERFQNPFIDHSLLAICLNCTSKWKARVLPSLKAYFAQKGTLPTCLTASFAFYIALYRDTPETLLKDDAVVMDFFRAHRVDSAADLVYAVCANTAFWDEDLTTIPGFVKAVATLLEEIITVGSYEVMRRCL